MSEEYYYNRSENIQGVSDIDLTKIYPSYGMTVKFKAENKTMDFTDGYFKKTPYGLNSLKAVFNFSYEADHDTIQKVANNLEKLNNKVGFTNSTRRVLAQNKIYKNLPGFVNEYSIDHQNKNRYILSTSLSVGESPNLLNWKTSSFLNVDIKTWQEGTEFEKDDIVYLPTNTSTTTNFRLGNIFYCKKDHKSVFANNPFYGRKAKSYWTQDFEWQPDEKFETSLDFNSEKFGSKFKTRKKEENAGNLDVKNLFSSISDKQALAMLHFLETRAGYRRFRCQIPSIYNRPKVLISESWEHKWNYDNNHTITFDFIEDKLGVMPKEKEDNYYTQSSFYKKKFDTDYLPNSERFGFYDGSRNWYDYYAFFSDFDDQSSNPDDFYVPPITQLIFDPGGINSGVFEVDTKTYIGASVEQTISTDIPDNWKLGNASIDGVSIGTSCTNIGINAFYGTSLDQQLFIPPTVTGIKLQAFRECDGITGDLFIPPSVIEIGDRSFEKLLGLTNGNIFISDDSLKEPVTTIGYRAFYQAQFFSGNLIIGNGVKSIGNDAFRRSSLSIGAAKAGRLELGECTETIGNYSFYDNRWSGPLYIRDSIKLVGSGAFGLSREFESVYLGSSLEEVQVGSFSALTKVQGDLIFPKSLRIIGDYAFSSCTFDGKLDINLSLLEKIGSYAFKGCKQFQRGNLIFGPSCEEIGAEAFRDLWSWDGVISLPTNQNYTKVESRTFNNMWQFTSDLEIPKNITSIGTYAFQSLGNAGGPVSGINKCGTLTLNESLQTIEKGGFSQFGGVGDLIIPDSVTSIGVAAFYDMPNMDGILKISKNITRIEAITFSRSNKLRGTINIPDGVTFIGASAFQQCSGFTRLNLPDSLEVIQSSAFFLCNSLGGDIFIPDKVTRIEFQTFYDCYPIRSLRLSPFTTYIGPNAFTNCVGLSGVLNIPNTITEIASLAFRNCSSVTRINIRAATAPIITDAFRDMDSVVPPVIHVPVGAAGYAASYNGLTVVYDL